MKVPLDWIGFHYYTRRIVSDASGAFHPSSGGNLATETEGHRRRSLIRYTQTMGVMPTEGPLTDGGLEIWPRGIYDLVMQITREYNHPIIEITESGCGYLDTPYEKEGGHVPDTRRIDFFREELAELARSIADGAKVRAFHAWSLLDNFEWADGYSPALRSYLRGLPRSEAHRKGLGAMVRHGCGNESPGSFRLTTLVILTASCHR